MARARERQRGSGLAASPEHCEHEILDRFDRWGGGERFVDPAARLRAGVAEGSDRLERIESDAVAFEADEVDGALEGAVAEGRLGHHLPPQGGNDLVGDTGADAGEAHERSAVFLLDRPGDGANRKIHGLDGLDRAEPFHAGELAEEIALGAAEEAHEQGHRRVSAGVIEDVQADLGGGAVPEIGIGQCPNLGPEERRHEHLVTDAADIDLHAQLPDVGVGEEADDVGDHGAILRCQHRGGPGTRRLGAVPELPEVETIRRDLEPLVMGRTVAAVDVDPGTIDLLMDLPVEALRAGLVGRRFVSLGRRGKYLLFGLDDGRTFVVHLRMTGRIVWRAAGDAAIAYERARISLDGGHDLRWSDLRKFGTWAIVEDAAEAVGKLGPEPLDEAFTVAFLRKLLAGRSAPVKAVLLDQRHVAGLGNIYVDEALFAARIRPDTPAGEVSRAAVARLQIACREVLERGIENRGASFRDYVDAQGEQGRQHMYVQVFRRDGKPCYACGTTIARAVVGGRGTHYCPRCQRKPRRRRSPGP